MTSATKHGKQGNKLKKITMARGREGWLLSVAEQDRSEEVAFGQCGRSIGDGKEGR